MSGQRRFLKHFCNGPRRGRSFPCSDKGLRRPVQRSPGRRMSSQRRFLRCSFSHTSRQDLQPERPRRSSKRRTRGPGQTWLFSSLSPSAVNFTSEPLRKRGVQTPHRPGRSLRRAAAGRRSGARRLRTGEILDMDEIPLERIAAGIAEQGHCSLRLATLGDFVGNERVPDRAAKHVVTER
jgi:hypothetical protein